MRHRADRPTTEHKTNSPEQTDRAGLPQALSAVTHQCPICRSVTQMKKTPVFPFWKKNEENQTAN